jgi:putative tryptophan/tyrosine transport system substrate-binding protein
MRRREFITLLGGSAVAWPLVARAQQTGKARQIGLLMITAKSDPQAHADRDAFEKGLRALGWTPDKNIHLEYRWAAGDPNLLRKYAAELVGMAPDVILTEGTPGLATALEATKSIPIIFASVTDPVGQGLVASLARPGGNATGFTAFEFSMGSKWVEILRELVPSVKHIGLLFNPAMAPYSELYLQAIRAAAETFKIDTNSIPVADNAEITRSLSALMQQPHSGLIVLQDGFTQTHRDFLIAQISERRIPAVYTLRFYVQSGGLVSYGIDMADPYRQAASYIDRVLKGANPGELAVQQPTKFELVINLKSAKAMGIDVPASMLSRADEVIE